MSELFQRNLDAIARRYPDLAARLRAHTPSAAYRRVSTASKLWDLSVPTPIGESECCGGPNPLEDAIAYWKTRNLRNPAVVVFLGLDLGYRLVAYLSNPNPNTQTFVLVERDIDLFHHLLHVVTMDQLLFDSRVHLLVGLEPDTLFSSIRNVLEQDLCFTKIKATHFEAAPVSYGLHKDYYRAAVAAVRDAATDIMNYIGNSPLDAFIGVRHMLLNVDTIAREPGINLLRNQFAGRPGVVVATGPSLDKNFRLLAEIQDRALLFTVDASLRFLLTNGIRPHFVTCLERVPETIPFFTDLPLEACRDTVQVAIPVVVPQVYAAYPGPKAVALRTVVHFDWLEIDKGTLATGHSSANMAFKLAQYLGCDPIILVGQDLAYADDGTTHASAAYWGTRLEELDPTKVGAFKVPGNTTEWVLTNDTWNMFRLTYVRDVADFPGTVINATEGGAHIQGTRVMPLREAIDSHVAGAFSPAESVRKLLVPPTPDEAEGYLTWLRSEHIPATVETIRDEMERLKTLGQEARQALSEEHRLEGLAKILTDLFGAWRQRLVGDPLFGNAAFPLFQATFVHALVDFHDVPNHCHHIEDIHRRRISIIAQCIDQTVAMLDRLQTLYSNPEDTDTPGT